MSLRAINILNQVRNKSNSASSKRWINRQISDKHTRDSKLLNYRSRAAFKLIELDQKFKLFNRKTRNIVDLGFAPGAWTQVALERTKKLNINANIIGVDLIQCSPPDGAHFIQGDILSRATHSQIRDFFNKVTNEESDVPVDLIISDMMANTSGIKDNDHFASMDLCDGAIILSCSLLKKKGSLVMKYYSGREDQLLLEKLQKMFHKVYRMKPEACRNELKELYFIGVNKKCDKVDARDLFNE